MAPQTDDPFDDLLTLEDTLYTTARDQGITDGARAGRIEGRIFGLEKGFEKFATLGELHGRGAVWGSRLSTASTPTLTPTPTSTPTSTSTPTLPQLPTSTSRLISNTTLLYHLTDPPTFSTANTEPSVADYDDRVKRASAKAKVIERIVGEASGFSTAPSSSSNPSSSISTSSSGARANDKTTQRRGGSVRLEGDAKKGKTGDDNMEDFVGSRLIG